jgi:hypothetical protein
LLSNSRRLSRNNSVRQYSENRKGSVERRSLKNSLIFRRLSREKRRI